MVGSYLLCSFESSKQELGRKEECAEHRGNGSGGSGTRGGIQAESATHRPGVAGKLRIPK